MLNIIAFGKTNGFAGKSTLCSGGTQLASLARRGRTGVIVISPPANPRAAGDRAAAFF
jgi:hypothetical protein